METAPLPTGGAGARTCPECGWKEGAAIGRPVMRRLAHLAPLIAVLLAAASLAAWLRLTASQHIIGSGVMLPTIAEPAFTRADIERIARGEPADPARPGDAVLARALLAAATVRTPEYPGSHAVEVGFAPGPGMRTHFRTIGWPTPWVQQFRRSNYEDGPRRAGFIAAETDPALAPLPKYQAPRDPRRIPPRPRWEWHGSALHYQPPPEATGGVDTLTRVSVFAPLLLAGAMILAWYGAGVLIWVFNRFRPRERRAPHTRVRLAAAAMVALAMVVAGLAGSSTELVPQFATPALTQVGVPPAPVYWARAGFERLPWSRAELETLAAEPGADALVAAEVRRLLGDHAGAAAAGAEYLAAAADCETQYDPGQCSATVMNQTVPVLVVYRVYYVRRPDFGAPEWIAPPAGITVRREHGAVIVGLATGEAKSPVYRLRLEPNILAAVVVGLWAVFAGTRFVTVVRGRMIRAGRARRGECVACGYPLPKIAATVAKGTSPAERPA